MFDMKVESATDIFAWFSRIKVPPNKAKFEEKLDLRMDTSESIPALTTPPNDAEFSMKLLLSMASFDLIFSSQIAPPELKLEHYRKVESTTSSSEFSLMYRKELK